MRRVRVSPEAAEAARAHTHTNRQKVGKPIGCRDQSRPEGSTQIGLKLAAQFHQLIAIIIIIITRASQPNNFLPANCAGKRAPERGCSLTIAILRARLWGLLASS